MRHTASEPSAHQAASSHYQDRYIRHTNCDVRVDPNVSPAQDARFRLRPGLAGNGTVSFESANFPGHYPDRHIRHFGFQLKLDPIATATGRGDATFKVVAP